MSANSDLWLPYRKEKPQATMRLFCLPYAGGGASVFRTWEAHLPANIEVCAVQYPGRENRFAEPPFKILSSLLDALEVALSQLTDKPYAIFGHSMGALVGFFLSRTFQNKSLPLPRHLFVSSHRPPALPARYPQIHNLPDAEFSAELERLGGTPKEVLSNEELCQLVFPILRADFSVCHTYTYQVGVPLQCPITAFGGESDTQVNPAELAAWATETGNSFNVKIFKGDHFFLNNNLMLPLLLETISMTLQNTDRLSEVVPAVKTENEDCLRW